MIAKSEILTQETPEQILFADLPESMRELVGIVPIQAVLAIVEEYGGSKLYIPMKPRLGKKFTETVGIESAQALTNYAGGSVFEIPIVAKFKVRLRHFRVLASLQNGASHRAVARDLNMTERSVRNIYQKYGKNLKGN